MDSKGEAHILEHTALCGSENTPFVIRSFNDSSFTETLYERLLLRRTGQRIHLRLRIKKISKFTWSVFRCGFAANLNPLDLPRRNCIEFESGEPVYKGVVFNEMKGQWVPSDSSCIISWHHLFPETTYHYNSGGDLKPIGTLTIDELVDFYKSHYHPSNAVFMTLVMNLLIIRSLKLYLAKFSKRWNALSKEERRLTAPARSDWNPAVDAEDLKDKTYHIISWLLPKASEIKLRLGMRLVEGVLLEDLASPLRHYLETCGYAQSTGPIMG